MAIRRSSPNRGITQKAINLPEADAKSIRGPFRGTMQAGPARPTRAHGLSDEHQDRGLVYVDKGIWDDAIKEFQKSVDLTPDFSEGWNNLGLCMIYVDRVDEGIKALKEALKHFPGWHLALANMGYAYHKANKPDQAMDCYKQAVTKNPKNPQIWAALGEALEAAGKADEAIENYKNALTHAPRYDVPNHRLGMLLARKSDFEEAEKLLKVALELNPKAADAAGVLGAISARRGQLDAAREYFELAKSIKPDKVPATAQRGLAAIEAYQKGIASASEEVMGQYNDLPSIAECMFNAGLSYLKAGNTDQARNAFENAVQEDDQWAEPLTYLGLIAAMQKRPLEARKHWEAARKLDPKNGMICEGLGLACLALGLNKEADRNFDEARKLGRTVQTQVQASASNISPATRE
ncbi:MAG: tetratricopeptide repeat protein [Planctomycetota bacterium]|nr:tetratricopeptide repeat protein [Planctomycetota bacterium]